MKTRIVSFLAISNLVSTYGYCEVTLDGSLGSAAVLDGPRYQITENLGKRSGVNLFHSFGKFNLRNTESATFSGAKGINNVVARVTGGQASNIDGTLRVTIPNANLFLLNPAGIIFGKNAKLDVPGSFHTSTADFLRFQDGVQFNSKTPAINPILTTAEPEAFGFLDEKPASISLTGGENTILEVPHGETLALIGGDITIKDASLYAPGGHVNLVSVGSKGSAVIEETAELNTASFNKMGHINISQGSHIPHSVSQQNLELANIDVSANQAGKVFVRGGQFVLEKANIQSTTVNGNSQGIDIGLTGNLIIENDLKDQSNGIITQNGINAHTLGAGNAGNIVLDVDGSLVLTDDTTITSFSGGTGKGGDLKLKAENIRLTGNTTNDNPQLGTSALAQGNAGKITIIASDNVEINNGALVFSISSSDGSSGEIAVNARSLKISQARLLTFTSANGMGGDIIINADDIVSVEGPSGGILSQTKGNGYSGKITITSNHLEVRNGTWISTTTSSTGNSGDIVIDVNDAVLTNNQVLMPPGFAGTVPTGITAQILDVNENGSATGHSGSLTLMAEHLSISNGAEITTSNGGQGNSGNLLIKAKKVRITNNLELDDEQNRGGIKANLFFDKTGNSGDLTVITKDLFVENGTEISTSNYGVGNSGNLLINAKKILLSRNRDAQRTGIFNTNYGAGKLGSLIVNAENLRIQNGAEIDAATNAVGNGGQLEINSKFVSVYGAGSEISTRTRFKSEKAIVLADLLLSNNQSSMGRGGDLALNVDNLDIRKNAVISTSTFGDGDSGKLNINAKNISIQGDQADLFTGISSQANGSGAGNAGDLQINSGLLDLRNGARVSSSTFDSGRAGDLIISAENISLSHAFLESASFFENPDLLTRPNIAMSGGIVITIHNRLQLADHGAITVMTKQANAGMIKIDGHGILKLNQGSEILTSVAGGKGTGGNINITTPFLILNGSSIKAQAIEGAGGNIRISSLLFHSPDSVVSASSKLSMDGIISLKPDTNVSGTITKLPDTLMDAPHKISDHCVNHYGQNISSFIVKGSEESMVYPGFLMPSTYSDYVTSEQAVIQKTGLQKRNNFARKNYSQVSAKTEGCKE